jgi:hypothetical protein
MNSSEIPVVRRDLGMELHLDSSLIAIPTSSAVRWFFGVTLTNRASAAALVCVPEFFTFCSVMTVGPRLFRQ